MTLARRVAKLEAGRTPTEIVLAWLAEAHAYPTLPAYVAAVRDAAADDWPLARIARQVEAAVRASVRGTAPEVWQAVRRAVGDALVLVELVLQANLAAAEVRDVAGLRWALLSKWLGLLAAESELARVTRPPDPEHAAQETEEWRAALAVTLSDLYVEAAARASLEQRYLAGRSVLFPALAQAWADLVARLEWLVEPAERLAPGSSAEPLDLAELHAQAVEPAARRAQELADLARIAALELLGERERALAVLERHLRALTKSTPDGPRVADPDPAAAP